MVSKQASSSQVRGGAGRDVDCFACIRCVVDVVLIALPPRNLTATLARIVATMDETSRDKLSIAVLRGRLTYLLTHAPDGCMPVSVIDVQCLMMRKKFKKTSKNKKTVRIILLKNQKRRFTTMYADRFH